MEIKLTFNKPLNASLQIGDTVWYVNTNQAGGYQTASSSQTFKLGTVEKFNNTFGKYEIFVSNYVFDFSPNISNSFIMFSKEAKANTTSLKGYYALARFENNSKEKAELYAVGSEINESSK